MRYIVKATVRMNSSNIKLLRLPVLTPNLLLGFALLFPLQLFGAEQSEPPEPYVVPQTQKSG